jgi:dipeptide/tripeptide permease
MEKTPVTFLEAEKALQDYSSSEASSLPLDDDGNEASQPTEDEKKSLRKVAGKIPSVAYWLCAVEFSERASFYGVNGLFNNFINQKLPKNGNGLGAPPRGSKATPGALGKGKATANATSQSFKMLVYALPVLFGWLADSKTGRWRLIVWGVFICGLAHVIMVRIIYHPSVRTSTDLIIRLQLVRDRF